MKLKNLLPFVVAIVLAGAAVYLGRETLRRAAGENKERNVKVLVAARDLDPGQQLKDSDVTLSSLPATSVPPSALMNASDVEGRVVAIPVAKGQTLVKNSLAADNAGMGLQALVPPGMRAVTIEVNEFSGVGGLLFPGCRVDVIATMVDEDSKRPVARPIVENALVTAVGQRMSARPQGSRGEVVTGPVKSVTMIVPTRDAVALDLAASKGRPRLALRGASDLRPSDSARVTISDLTGNTFMNESFAAAPASNTLVDPFEDVKGSKNEHSVQVIYGGDAREIRFDSDPPTSIGTPR